MNYTEQALEVMKWLDNQILSYQFETDTLFNSKIVRHFGTPRDFNSEVQSIQIYRGIKLIAEILDIPYDECDWHGNEDCNVNYLERSLMYKGYQFYSIGTKKDFEDEDKMMEEI